MNFFSGANFNFTFKICLIQTHMINNKYRILYFVSTNFCLIFEASFVFFFFFFFFNRFSIKEKRIMDWKLKGKIYFRKERNGIVRERPSSSQRLLC